MEYRLTDWVAVMNEDAIVRHLVRADDEDHEDVVATFGACDLGARAADAVLALANGDVALTDRIPATEAEVLERAIERMGWPEIRAFEEELDRGQDVCEDAGGFMLRAVRRLFGLPSPQASVLTYQQAARAMVRRAA